ncbi:MAG: DUF4040 domain-containing protein [Actinobacteria bacterium]|nr:MAG: DUF4040 domain-containing protein [Actinomycetota bacterium]
MPRGRFPPERLLQRPGCRGALRLGRRARLRPLRRSLPVKASDILVDVFLASGVIAQLIACIGVVAFDDVFDRLHFSGAGATLGPLLIGARACTRNRHGACGAAHRFRSGRGDGRRTVGEMIPLQVVIIVLVGAAALAVVRQADPLRQTLVNGFYGLSLVVLFVVFQAPDVALSMIVVGSIAYPLILLVAIARVRGRAEDTTDTDKQ